jgi:hypothetical protein
MSALYTVTRTSAALSTSNDHVTIVAASGKPLYIHSVSIEGEGTASAANEVVMARSSGGTTGGGAITAGPNDPGQSAASFSAYTTWSAQPTLGQVLWRFGVNANGGASKRETPPGMAFFVPASGQISFRSVDGTSNVIFSCQVEEIA